MAQDAREATNIQKKHQSQQNQLNIGCTISSNPKVKDIEDYLNADVRHFQIVADFTRSGQYIPPHKMITTLATECDIVLHMPFYYHLLLKPEPVHMRRFKALEKFWQRFYDKIDVIVHCKGIHANPTQTKLAIKRNAAHFAQACPKLRLLLENDAGGKTNPPPVIAWLDRIKYYLHERGIEIGMCLDTEHAYAAGEHLEKVDWWGVDMVHLNAVPKDVRFGFHLDRHSITPLTDSKHGVNFVTEIIKRIRPSTPLVLERTDHHVTMTDITFLKRLKYAKTMDQSKNSLAKNIQQGAKILL